MRSLSSKNQGVKHLLCVMIKWVDDNYILMYSTHTEGKSVVAERFTRTLKGKFSKQMTANNSKSYLGYLDELVDECNNSYYHLNGKKAIDADNSALIEKIETNLKAPKFKVGDRVRTNKYKNSFSKGCTEN